MVEGRGGGGYPRRNYLVRVWEAPGGRGTFDTSIVCGEGRGGGGVPSTLVSYGMVWYMGVWGGEGYVRHYYLVGVWGAPGGVGGGGGGVPSTLVSYGGVGRGGGGVPSTH